MEPLSSTSIPDLREPSLESEAFVAEINRGEDELAAQLAGFHAFCDAKGLDPNDPESLRIAVETLPKRPTLDLDQLWRNEQERRRRRNEKAAEKQRAEDDRRREAANAEVRQYAEQRALMRGRDDYCQRCDWGPCRHLELPDFCAHCHKTNCAGATPRCPEDARARWDEQQREQREQDAEAAAALRLPTLRDLLGTEPAVEPYRIDRLWHMGDSVLFDAYAKGGKTRRRNEVVKRLADGGKLFGEFDVVPLNEGETVWVFDFEMTEQLTREWLGQLGIEHDDRIVVVPLRGLAHLFDMRDATVRTYWATRLRAGNCRVAILDCLAPVLASLGIDENGNGVQQFGQGWRAMLREAGVAEDMLIHHQGKNGDTRGHSSLVGDAGALWSLSMTNRHNPNSPRTFNVAGRVDGAGLSGRLDFDPTTGLSTYAPGSKQPAAGAPAADEGTAAEQIPQSVSDAVVAFVKANPDCSQRSIERGVREGGVKARVETVRVAIKLLVDDRKVVRAVGRRGSTHSLAKAA